MTVIRKRKSIDLSINNLAEQEVEVTISDKQPCIVRRDDAVNIRP
jgi:hypothetical protein